jgi:hypothetical protein
MDYISFINSINRHCKEEFILDLATILISSTKDYPCTIPYTYLHKYKLLDVSHKLSNLFILNVDYIINEDNIKFISPVVFKFYLYRSNNTVLVLQYIYLEQYILLAMQTELNMVDNLLKNIQQLEVVVSNKYNQCNESINEIDSLICTIESKDTIINNLRDNIYKKNTELLKLENKNRSLINEKTRLIKIDSLDNNNYCCIIS